MANGMVFLERTVPERYSPHFGNVFHHLTRFYQSTFLQSIAERDIEIPEHIDIYLVRGEAEPSETNAVDFIIASAREKVARLEQRIEDLPSRVTLRLSTLLTRS
jgi:hypothetical protein